MLFGLSTPGGVTIGLDPSACLRIMVSRGLIHLLLACCLIACSSGYRAPVEDRNASPKASAPGVYYVTGGDTLYSISWRYGLDFRSVARANSIASPYTIFPGQKLYLKSKAPAKKSTSTAKSSQNKATSSKNAAYKPPASAPTPKPLAVSKQTTTATSSGAKVSKWRWPTKGKVTRGYSSTVHKGIDISGKRGDSVNAVAAGRVVYAGTGIVGYGELIIVKHNDVYLSAYGHNYRLLVDEGAQVAAGQKIAEKGSSGTDSVKLHFEIRKEGKPVDPQKLLP